jgi:hypothetical protein
VLLDWLLPLLLIRNMLYNAPRTTAAAVFRGDNANNNSMMTEDDQQEIQSADRMSQKSN